MSKRCALLAALIGVASVTGCAPEADETQSSFSSNGDDGSAVDPSDIGERVSAITGGSTYTGGGVGAVEIQTTSVCTGVLVGGSAILTASHCFDGALGGSTYGTVAAKVSYAVNGTTWRCMTGSPSTGKCTTKRDVWVYRSRRTGESDAANDFALVIPWSPSQSWQNIFPGDAAEGVYTGALRAGDPYMFVGRGNDNPDGTGSGTMRTMTDTVDYVEAERFITDADYIRLCTGDSGGPYYRSGARWVFGLASNVEASGKCATVGGKQRSARMSETKMTQLNKWLANEGRPQCRRHSAEFPSHWVCP